MADEITPPASPDPTRAAPQIPQGSPQTIGKVGAYLFAFFAAVLVASQTVSIKFKNIDGHQEFTVESKDSVVYVPGLVLIGLSLGVNLSPEAIATLIMTMGRTLGARN
jgi:hypothetical protein